MDVHIGRLIEQVDPSWAIVQGRYDPGLEPHYETVFTLANGYVGVEGSMDFVTDAGTPGTYFAGVFDVREDQGNPRLAVAPSWTWMDLRIGGEPVNLLNGRVVSFRRVLDMKRGLLLSVMRLRDRRGRVTTLRSMRVVSRADEHVSLIRVEIEPENYTADAEVRFLLDADTLAKHPRIHGEFVQQCALIDAGQRGAGVFLEATTTGTQIRIGLASCTSGRAAPRAERAVKQIAEVIGLRLKRGSPVAFNRVVTFYTGRDTPEPAAQALQHLARCRRKGLAELLAEHFEAMDAYWRVADVRIDPDRRAQRGLRWCILQLIQLANPRDPDYSPAAKGLHGLGYAGHVFWDTELFMLPFYQVQFPQVGRMNLMYRYRRLDAARRNAAKDGYRGARFPWESARDGSEVTPTWANTGLYEIHISADVALAFVNHLKWTNDVAFFRRYGVEVIAETARFFATKAERDKRGRYHLRRVIGPDEFHEEVDDNYATNFLAAWNMREALQRMRELKRTAPHQYRRLAAKIRWTPSDERLLATVAQRMAYPPIRKGVCEQHAGFFRLRDVPMLRRAEYGRPVFPDVPVQQCQILKQADVVLLHLLFEDAFSEAVKRASYEYYEPRTCHGSSLSASSYCMAGLKLGIEERAYNYFLYCALLDVENLRGDTAGGLHAANAGGAWQCAVFGFGGVSVREGRLRVEPRLAGPWRSMQFSIGYHGRRIQVEATKRQVRLALDGPAMELLVAGRPVRLKTGRELTVPLKG